MSAFAASSSTQLLKRLQKELSDLLQNPPCGCSGGPKGDNLFEWACVVQGPETSPYHGGTFFLDVMFPSEYPFVPPLVAFRSRIYHCNVNSKGKICLDILKDAWTPTLTISDVLMAIRSLMLACNPYDPLVGPIGLQYLEDRMTHDRIAADWTARFAS